MTLPFTRSAARRVTIARLLLAATLLLPLLVRAQFNGPADTARDTVNAPHVLTTDPAILYPPLRPAHLRGGDKVKVTLYGLPDYSAEDRIANDGMLSVPLIDPVQVEGLTVFEAQDVINHKLSLAGMFVRPQSHIEVVESPTSIISVIGEVHQSVPVPTGSRRLFDVLAVTGFPSTASHLITIERPGSPASINLDLGSDPERSRYANIPLFAGDTVVTSNIGRYYLLGAFRQQGAYPLNSNAPLTLVQMVAASGGRLFEAKLDQVHIVRTVGTQRTVVTVDLKAAIEGHAPDPVIQNDDIIFAPTNALKSAIRNGGFSTVFGIAITAASIFR